MMIVAMTRHESVLGTWAHAQWNPPVASPLAGAIERIWHFEGTLGGALERAFPDGTLELIVQLDTPHGSGGGETTDLFPPLCVTGLRTTAEVVKAPLEYCRVLGVRLTPPAAFRLLGVSLSELTSKTADLHDVLGKATDELEARVRDARDAQAAVRAAADWAAQRIVRGRDADTTVQRALRAIVEDGGARSIAALDAWRGRSRARFGTAFRDCVGVSPKRFARIVRFNRALDAIVQSRATLGDIALAAGYYDQAHFTSDFREHAGMTPGAYLRANRYPGTTSIVDDAEHFLQDAATAFTVDSAV